MQYTEKKFALPGLDGLSKNAVDQHLALYSGYVKNFNAITALAGELMKDSEKNMHAIAELMRRRSFEFDGMRLHEYYFEQFEGHSTPLTVNSPLHAAIAAQYGDADYCMQEIRHTAMMRGVGWAILYFDPVVKQFLVGFSEQQHQGHFVTLPIILALDVWEHAFVIDYGTTGRGKYIDACFKNYNWGVMEERYTRIA